MWSWSRLPDGISRASAYQLHISGNFTLVANYHRAREILEAISEINRELLRRREAL
jgi:hypothetical protein